MHIAYIMNIFVHINTKCIIFTQHLFTYLTTFYCIFNKNRHLQESIMKT